MKKTLLLCCGMSGSGKSYFIKNTLPAGLFHNLKSATTRPMRPKEVDGREYYFRDETYFDTTPLATRLWVNEAFWTPGKPKWLYGVPEFEILDNLGRNMTYDVIQPKYARQLIDWFKKYGLTAEYNCRVAYFISPEDNLNIAQQRANMPDDMAVRTTNTCTPTDFINAGLEIDYLMMPRANIISPKLLRHINKLRTR